MHAFHLRAVVRFFRMCVVLADVGSEHGYLNMLRLKILETNN
jgi:tRNA A22 N-methylase